MQENKEKQLKRVVWDIDGTLAIELPAYAHSLPYLLDVFPWIVYFNKMSLIMEVEDYLYAILPGVIETIQLLDQRDDIEIVFFSAAHESRNKIFVDKLMSHALGEKRYAKIKDRIKIFSRDHQKDISDPKYLAKRAKQSEQFGPHYHPEQDHNLKKDLKVIVDKTQLPWTILVDDKPAKANFKQEHNLLCIPSAHWLAYSMTAITIVTLKMSSFATFNKVNGFYYAAGMLFTMLEESDEKDICLVSALKNLQWNKLEESDHPDYIHAHKDSSVYYDKGLSKLQTINPQLVYFDEAFFSQHEMKLPETPEAIRTTDSNLFAAATASLQYLGFF